MRRRKCSLFSLHLKKGKKKEKKHYLRQKSLPVRSISNSALQGARTWVRGAGVTVNGTRTTESELPPGGFSNNFVPCRDP